MLAGKEETNEMETARRVFMEIVVFLLYLGIFVYLLIILSFIYVGVNLMLRS